MIHPPFELPAIKIFYQNEQYDDCHVVVVDDKYIDKIITKHLTIVPASVFYAVEAYIQENCNKTYIQEHEKEWFDKDLSRSFRKKTITDLMNIKKCLPESNQQEFDHYVSNALWCFGL